MYCTSSVSWVTTFSLACICLNLVSSSHLISRSALTSETWKRNKNKQTKKTQKQKRTLDAEHLNVWHHKYTNWNQTPHLVSFMGLIRETKGHTESVIVVLKEGVSVPALVQSGHCLLELLQPCAKILLGPPSTGQVGLHHPSQREVVPYICTLRDTHMWILLDYYVFVRHISH